MFRSLWAIILIVWLLTTLLAANVCQILTLIVWPARGLFDRLNRGIIDIWISMVVWLLRDVQDVQIRYYGDQPKRGENVLLIANHVSANDVVILLPVAGSVRHAGDINYFTKDILKWLPGLGWGLWLRGFLTVKRDLKKDKGSITTAFNRVLDRGIPIWLMLFPEGTRQTPEKLKASRIRGFQNHLPDLKHVLIPKAGGFVASVTALRKHLGAVYDVTIGYPEGVSTLWQLLRGEVGVVSLHVRRFPMSHFANLNEEGLRNWLLMRFVQKDKLLMYFSEHGEFPS